MPKQKKRKKRFSHWDQRICLSKTLYWSVDKAQIAAETAGLRLKIEFKTYKCPIGQHWHIAKKR